MGEVQDKLEAHLKPLAGPFLFVGAGLSRRYAGLPSWAGLLEHFTSDTPHPYAYYAELTGQKLPDAASRIAKDFHEVWWSSDEYKDLRQAAGALPDYSSALKHAMARYVNDILSKSVISADVADEWELLQKATVDAIITTNYDGLLERAFPEFEPFVGQEELIFSDAAGIGEIYHIHGAASEPESLVLTAEDYAKFDERSAYLAAKLLTFFVEHPVIFLGYSMGDPNIQAIIQSIAAGLTDKNIGKLSQRLIFVEWDSTATATYSDSTMMIGGNSIPVTRISAPDFREVFAALGKRERAISARMVRLLKNQIYDLVLSNDPAGLLYAYTDIDSESAKAMDVVFGLGAKKAIKALVGASRADIFRDVLESPSADWPAKAILEQHISNVRATDWYPVFKYLSGAGYLMSDGSVDLLSPQGAVPARAAQHANRNIEKIVTKVAYRRKYDMATLLEKHDWKWVFTHILELPSHTADVEGIRTFLIGHLDKIPTGRWSTDFAKGVVIYDFMKYGPGRTLVAGAPRS